MFDVEGKWPNKVEQTGSTLGLSEIRTAVTPPVHDIIHRQRASFSPLIHSQWQLRRGVNHVKKGQKIEKMARICVKRKIL